jgi:hypothetical protein
MTAVNFLTFRASSSDAAASTLMPSQEELRPADATVEAKGYRGSRLQASGVLNDKQEQIGTIVEILVS